MSDNIRCRSTARKINLKPGHCAIIANINRASDNNLNFVGKYDV